MNLLTEAATSAIAGGVKLDPGIDPSPRPSQPVPIWHPVFIADP